MTFYQQNIDFGIGRHKEMVRVGERRALQIAESDARPVTGGTFYQKAVGRLAGRLASWAHDLLHLRAPARGEQLAG